MYRRSNREAVDEAIARGMIAVLPLFVAEGKAASTLGEMVSLWVAMRNAGPKPFSVKYTLGIRTMMARLGHLPSMVAPISSVWGDPGKWQAEIVTYCRTRNLAPGTIDLWLRAFNNALGDMCTLIDSGHQWSSSPLSTAIIVPAAAELPAFGPSRRQPPIPSRDDMTAFLAACRVHACASRPDGTPTQKARMAGMMLMIACTGMRPKEARSIRAVDVVMDAVPGEHRVGVILIDAESTKAKRSREITITPFLWEIIRRFVEQPRRSGHIFSDQLCSYVHDALDMPVWISPRQLRCNYVTKLLQSGVAVATVSDLVGHASIQTTMTYVRRDDASERDRVAATHVPNLIMQE